ncbi:MULTISPECIES: LLM class flavin-dependent oxidoreductase [Paraburkholderia]|uniref:Flavin-dependent oxidoreductase n=1 Tax=Paraburkholderia dioscoreae TaxID=2604047 RepID=A0A5Q4ZBD3_9BURK|nr:MULTISPECIES: LLM class flavin-dependent oxidoreductase [Paraburkholderia]MDR8397113.1 LLM class flavin-dependent oxidoreductase [Paraburkholderia sp. USG1]VVD27504.1 Flavin-dependent oxidoreductase [Paraburkholderia dioscoreae]
MKLGIFMQPLHLSGAPYHAMYDMDIACAIHADKVGYDELWMGEHTSQRTEPVTNALQFLSTLIPLTERIKLCTGVLNLPHHHPARIAADAAMFDHMSKGRFIMGIGPGGLASDFEVYKSDHKASGAMLASCYQMIRAIWNTDAPYDLKTAHHEVSIKNTVHEDLGVGLMPVPYQNPFPRVATSAMSNFSSTAKLAGANDWDVISANFNLASTVASHWQAYTDGALSAGVKPDRRNWRVARSVFVADSQAEADEYLARETNALATYFDFMVTHLKAIGYASIFKSRPDMTDDEVNIEHCIREMVIAGDANSVVEQLVAFSEKTGPFGTLLTTFHEWDDEPLWRRSMELTAKQVMPRLSEYMEPRLADKQQVEYAQ